MSSDSYGLSANSPYGYPAEKVPWSTKISTDGIYLHELDSTIWDQDNGYDVSHGCLNLDHDNAQWFFTHSLVGDPVIIHGAKGAPELQLWQGGDWTLSWAQWQKGSALHNA
jgi:lipoprotein-anchoring transpeptidase ErfK/SrfK